MEAQIIAYLASVVPYGPTILMVLGFLVVVGMAVVALTPSVKDDEYVEKLKSLPIIGNIILALAAFSPIQKKAPAQLQVEQKKPE